MGKAFAAAAFGVIAGLIAVSFGAPDWAAKCFGAQAALTFLWGNL